MEIDGRVLDVAQRATMGVLSDSARPDVYLWGPPGRGKTWLVDSYIASNPRDRVLRKHFHEFFAEVHGAIRVHGSLAGALDSLLAGFDLVCFDEFHVHDPADGQYVTALLARLRERAIRTIVTSNYPPRDLMPNPLFHSTFAPTIALISRTFRIVECDGGTDYRQAPDEQMPGAWLTPGTVEQLKAYGLPSPVASERTSVRPAGHRIVADRAADGEVWFQFGELCETPTAPIDYLSLAQIYGRWVITGVPAEIEAEAAQRFANLVDVLWEKQVEVVITSTALPDALITGRAAHDLDRMLSRLSQLTAASARSSSSDVSRSLRMNDSAKPATNNAATITKTT